jgi:DNA-binding transcriptional LysR family regulator
MVRARPFDNQCKRAQGVLFCSSMERTALSSLTIYIEVATRRSFRAAARQLNLSPSAVSHAIGGLEAKLGVRLLARNTRSVAPTEAGQLLLERLKPALAEVDAAIDAAGEARERPSGLLRLTVPRLAADLVLLARAAEFAKAYPEITLELHADDHFADIVSGGFDAGIRLGESVEKDMIAVRLGPAMRMAVVGTASLLDGRPLPQHPRDLADYPCIRHRLPVGALYRWEFEQGGEQIEIAVQGPLILNDDRLIVDAARSGVGLGFVFEAVVAAEIARGELVRVLAEWCSPFPGFFLYHSSRRQMRSALRVFIDFMVRRVP